MKRNSQKCETGNHWPQVAQKVIRATKHNKDLSIPGVDLSQRQ